MPEPRASFVVRAGALLAGALILVISVEIFSSAVFYGIYRVLPTPAQMEELRGGALADLPNIPDDQLVHPYLGYVLPSRPFGYLEDSLPYEYHGFGFGMQPAIARKSPELAIVGIFGGSVAAYLGLDRESRAALISELEKLEIFRGRRIWLMNFANLGYKQPQHLLTLGYFTALGSELDMAIAIDGFNDIVMAGGALTSAGAFAAYPRGWPFMISYARVPEVQLEDARYRVYSRARAALASFFAIAPLRWSPTASLLWTRLELLLATRQAAIEERLALVIKGKDYHYFGPRRLYPSSDDAFQDFARIWENSSRQMELFCRANGVLYFHFLQPNQYVPGSKPIGEAERRVAYNPHHGYKHLVEAGYPFLRQSGKRLAEDGMNFRDMSMVFANHPEEIYIDECCHINGRGGRILAQAIVGSIKKQLESPKGRGEARAAKR